MKPVIVGAGLAGLIAACYFKDSDVIEAAPAPFAQHRALLRFRGTGVSELTGIPFKKVEVHKEVYMDGKTIGGRCPISAANQYALKVTGSILSRSIGNLETVSRYVAPDDLYQRLVDKVGHRINWNNSFGPTLLNDPHMKPFNFINTAPLTVAMAAAGMPVPSDLKFTKAPIEVLRIKLASEADVYQTIYFPDPETRVFRASITGNILIIESLIRPEANAMLPDWERDLVLESFGLRKSDLSCSSADMEVVDQRYGKIVDLPKADREAILYELTNSHRIFSLGRFATWRNVLLDDVVEDIGVIDRLMNASDYGRQRLMRS